jgi:branched-chain amino acid transport system permease protein
MEFWSTILLSATIAAIAAMGLFLQIRNGQMNVGMAVFSGIGGYVSGWLSTQGGLSPVLSIPVAVAAGFAAGVLYAALTLRLHHWFFPVTTLSLTIASVAAVSQLGFLGGALGMTDIPYVTSAPAIVAAALGAFAVAWGLDGRISGWAFGRWGTTRNWPRRSGYGSSGCGSRFSGWDRRWRRWRGR